MEEKLAQVFMHEIDLSRARCWKRAASISSSCWSGRNFRPAISGIANPKSSTGRIDVFTRLITDRGEAFDRVEAGYRGPLYAEISPQTFPILVRKGSRLNQLRIRHGSPQFSDTQLRRLHAETAAGGLRTGYR